MNKKHQFGGEWTEDKLHRLGKYLRAYMQIFKGNEAAKYFTTTYVDAFAGTGYRSQADNPNPAQDLFGDDDASGFAKGSAAIALDCKPPFDHYLFIERNPEYADELKRLQMMHGEKVVVVHQGDANAILKEWCRTTDWQRNRAVVFLDPYGMEVEWTTVEQLAKTQAVDLWWLFPPVQRLLPKRGPESKWVNAVTRSLGTDDWQKTFYQSKERRSLFGTETEMERIADLETIAQFIVGQLRTIFAEVAPKPRVLLNSKNSPIYLLCFASANPKGAKTAIKIAWPSNVWMGVSVEDSRVVERVRHLKEVPAKTRFLSCEPLIGPLDGLDLNGIHWVIVGGESGPGARPMKRAWVESIRRQCTEHNVAFFFKQWGGVRKKSQGRSLNGRTYDEFPSDLSVVA